MTISLNNEESDYLKNYHKYVRIRYDYHGSKIKCKIKAAFI